VAGQEEEIGEEEEDAKALGLAGVLALVLPKVVGRRPDGDEDMAKGYSGVAAFGEEEVGEAPVADAEEDAAAEAEGGEGEEGQGEAEDGDGEAPEEAPDGEGTVVGFHFIRWPVCGNDMLVWG